MTDISNVFPSTILPEIVLDSYIGNLLYTPSSLASNNVILSQLEISDLVFKDFSEFSLRELQNLPENQVHILSVRNIKSNQVFLAKYDYFQ